MNKRATISAATLLRNTEPSMRTRLQHNGIDSDPSSVD